MQQALNRIAMEKIRRRYSQYDPAYSPSNALRSVVTEIKIADGWNMKSLS